MASLGSIWKIARTELHPIMEKEGFIMAGPFSAYRRRGEIYDVVQGELLTSGRSLRLLATFWVPEWKPSYDMNKFPKGITFSFGGQISPSGVSMHDYLWDVGDADKISLMTAEFSEVFLNNLLPWFDSVTDRQSMVLHADVNLKNTPGGEERLTKFLRVES